MERPYVVVLGAGPDQQEILRAVNRAGFRPLAFDQNDVDEPVPGLYVKISNRDTEKIISACQLALTVPGAEIEGVIAAGSEVPEVVAAVQHRLGLPGMPVAAAFALRDKRLYKRALRAAGVPCTREALLWDEVVVSKPVGGAGSRDVTIGLHQMTKKGYVINGTTLLEAYQPGPQISSETIVWDGNGVTVAFADRHYDHANMTHPKELGVSMPSRWESEREKAHAVAMHAAAALGITRGTIKCDLVLTKQGPLIIECTSRLSGGPLAKLVREAEGVDYFKMAVEIACGDPREARELFGRPEQLLLLAPRKKWLKVSLDMDGNENDYEEVQKWIPKELPECV